ncbi:hypothetical protein FDP41_008272 [Naegleria fowleri]|uniref:RGS domain-containing protein n=1 Tax=Naegleria fowleri TaxID=5763 RepID=A0A6A5BHQ0_NAEFO|nr:uncharacterized protein FDP41_008272 [Naegleria fowleri]KAF0973568.1 hypothetical protein FDP41_008272 [Naegleria fowleri]CAG4709202.1 unnamed protein product [Naegleria fowleri]
MLPTPSTTKESTQNNPSSSNQQQQQPHPSPTQPQDAEPQQDAKQPQDAEQSFVLSFSPPNSPEGTLSPSLQAPSTSPFSNTTTNSTTRLTIGGEMDANSLYLTMNASSVSCHYKSLTPIPSSDKFPTLSQTTTTTTANNDENSKKEGNISTTTICTHRPEFFGGISQDIESTVRNEIHYKMSAVHTCHGSVAQHSTKSNNSLTKSTLENGDGFIHIKTCFGVLQLSGMKMLSLTSLTLNLFAFLLLALMISVAFVGQIMFAHKFDNLDLSSAYYREGMIGSCRSAVFSNISHDMTWLYIVKFENFSKWFQENMDFMVTSSVMRNVYLSGNRTFNDLKTFKAIAIERQAISVLKENGNHSVAMQWLDSPLYLNNVEAYSEEFQPLVDFVYGLQVFTRNFNVIITTACLVTIVVSFIVVAPTVIASLWVSLKRDTSNANKLKHVKALLLQDTMRDQKLKHLFKEHCKKELSLDNYSLLDKIHDYKALCEKSFDIQVYLFDSSDTSSLSDVTSETGSTLNESNSSHKKKKKKGYTEKDLREIEKKKFEIAFEIHTDYLDVHGDKSVNINKNLAEHVKQQLDFFATNQNEQLAEDLFDSVEHEICFVMMDTHMRFKASLENQKQSKKEILKNKKKAMK